MESRLRAATTVLTALLIAAALSFAAGVAHGQASDDPSAMSVQARKHLQLGLTHYQAKEYEDAIREFRAGYTIDPRPQFLFAIAQAERLSGDCTSAIPAYEKFLEMGPSKQQAGAARSAVERCRVALGADNERPADVEPAVAEPEQIPAQAGPEATDGATQPLQAGRVSGGATDDGLRRPWYRDKVGASLLGAGVASAAIGIGFYAASSSDKAAADTAPTYGEYQDLMERAESRRTVAWVGIAAGTALIGSAAVWYMVKGDDRERQQPAVALSVTPDGATVVYGATF